MTARTWKIIDFPSAIFLLSFIGALSIERSKNDVLLEYFPSSPKYTSDILKTTLTKEDFRYKVKILPERRNVILRVSYKQQISLLFAIAKPGPISLSISPCWGFLSWRLFWRPYLADTLEVVQAEGQPNTTVRGTSALEQESHKEQSAQLSKDRLGTRSKPNKDLKTGSFGVIELCEGNFTRPEPLKPQVRYVFRSEPATPLLEAELNKGYGRDPWLYQKEVAQPGLYIIKVRSLSPNAQIHALASRTFIGESQHLREVDAFKVRDSFKKQALTLSWGSRSGQENLFCLVVSRQKLYSSLCEAREVQRLSGTTSSSKTDGSLILGCTPDTHYNLPSSQNTRYFVSVWQQGSLIPLVQAKVQAKFHRKIQRLKSGVMMPFTLTAGGQVSAKFHIKKAGRKLHVAAVSCYGGVKVEVLAGKERVAAAKGREALHLAVRHTPKAELTIKVSPQPPLQALYRVHLVATHSARKLPIPRLPKRVEVEATPLNCSFANITWFKSPGGANYCIVLRRHPSGRPPEIRPPLQCGWEEVIRRHDYFHHLECFQGTREKQQSKLLTHLPPKGSFLVNVLVRHPVTGKTLTLSPTMLNLPKCDQSSSSITNESSFLLKQNVIL